MEARLVKESNGVSINLYCRYVKLQAGRSSTDSMASVSSSCPKPSVGSVSSDISVPEDRRVSSTHFCVVLSQWVY